MRDLQLTGERNQCPTCGAYFNSSSAFDFHRTGRFGVDRRCRTLAEMVTAGMVKNAAGFWIEKARPAATLRAGAAQSGSEVLECHPAEETRQSTEVGHA